MKQKNCQQNPGLFALVIWFLSITYYFYVTLLQVSPSVMVDNLMRDFTVNATAIGSLVGIYFYFYSGMQILLGVLLDRFGVRYILSVASLVCGFGCLLFSTTHSFFILEFSRVLIAISSAVAAIGSMHIAAKFFTAKRFPLLVGFMFTAGMLGAVFGLAPLSFLVTHLGWRHAVLLFAIIGFILAILLWLFIRDKKEDDDDLQQQAGLLKGLIFSLKSKKIWISSLYSSLLYAPIIAFGSLWGVPYLMRAYSISQSSAAMLVSYIFIGLMFGSPITGWTFEKYGKPLLHLLTGGIVSLIFISIVLYVPHLSQWLLIACMFVFGASSSVLLFAFTFNRQFAPSQYTSSAIGFTNMFNMLVGATAAPLIGVILDHFWQGNMSNGIRIYSTQSYHIALLSLPLLITCSLIFMIMLRGKTPSLIVDSNL